MDVFECIKTRRSIRNYLDQPIDEIYITKIMQAAIWAPSGKNGQPWKFKIITNKELINKISEMSIYGKWMKTAPCFICVFLDKDKSYDYIKDMQSCGAVIQNIMLYAYSIGVGSCWVGEILTKSKTISDLLDVPIAKYELMAVITLGYKANCKSVSNRCAIESFILN